MLYDAIIIGSGAGGAPVAHTLANAGKNVLVIEKGPLYDRQDDKSKRLSAFKRDELLAYGTERRIEIAGVENNFHSYYPSHVEPDLNDEPHIYRNHAGQDYATMEGYTAQVVGGGTQLYGGVSLRFCENDFRLKSFNQSRELLHDPNDDIKREARDWPVQYSELEPYYCKAEKLIGINGDTNNQLKLFSEDTYQQPLPPNTISQYAKIGMEQVGKDYNLAINPYRPPLAVITQDHPPSNRSVPAQTDFLRTSYVNRYGDPLGLKSNTWVTLLRPLMKLDNFKLMPNTTVLHIEAQNQKAHQVTVVNPAGVTEKIQGKTIVVACSAIESVRLLMLSGKHDRQFEERINKNELLGSYFLTHCFGGASGITPDRHDKSIALDADWATDIFTTNEFLNDKKLWAGAAIYNNTSDQALPLSVFRTHQSKDLDSLWQGFIDDTTLTGDGIVNFLDNQFGRNLSVSFIANQVPQRSNRIALHPTITDKWNRSSAYVIKDWHTHDDYLMSTLASQCHRILELGGVEDIKSGDVGDSALSRMANHILGGARFGDNPNDSVLDKNCRAWNFDNLYITDGSFMPTSGSANPTLTIQANAFRVADHILQQL